MISRSHSRLAQTAFDTSNLLRDRSLHAGFFGSLLARAAAKLWRPISKRVSADHLVNAHLYGHNLVMPSEHPLVATMQHFPQYNRPLGLAAIAVADSYPAGSRLTIIDVGANIGDTIALVEQWRPGVFSYLCIEPDANLAELCKKNHQNNSLVEVRQNFVGENEGAIVMLQDDGRANPSTKLATGSDSASIVGRLVRLDTAASSLGEPHGLVSLIKVDTEGYDFSVLRSGSQLLKLQKPALYFEWYPALLKNIEEDPRLGFEHLRDLGYRHFVFFTNTGDYYCNITDPDIAFLRGIESVAGSPNSPPYFDVFASTTEAVSASLVAHSLSFTPPHRNTRQNPGTPSFAPKNPKPAATSPSSGWSNPK